MSTLLIILIATFIANTVAEILYFVYSRRYIDLSDYGSCYESYGVYMSKLLWSYATYTKKDILIDVLCIPINFVLAPINFGCHLFICGDCIYYNIKKLNED